MNNNRSKPGYEYLLTYQCSVEIERLTDVFCQAYLNPYHDHRYIDHMNSSARSMARNIVEGYKRLGLKDYIEFLSFSRGSGEELLKDYQRLAEKWEITENREIWEIRKNWELQPYVFNIPFLPDHPNLPLNFLLSLVNITNYLLETV